MPPRFEFNTDDYTHVDETSFMSWPNIIEYNSKNEIDHETLNICFTNFEEELDEEVEINDAEDETPTPTSPSIELPEQNAIPHLPTYSKTVVRVKRSLVWTLLLLARNVYLPWNIWLGEHKGGRDDWEQIWENVIKNLLA